MKKRDTKAAEKASKKAQTKNSLKGNLAHKDLFHKYESESQASKQDFSRASSVKQRPDQQQKETDAQKLQRIIDAPHEENDRLRNENDDLRNALRGAQIKLENIEMSTK